MSYTQHWLTLLKIRSYITDIDGSYLFFNCIQISDVICKSNCYFKNYANHGRFVISHFSTEKNTMIYIQYFFCLIKWHANACMLKYQKSEILRIRNCGKLFKKYNNLQSNNLWICKIAVFIWKSLTFLKMMIFLFGSHCWHSSDFPAFPVSGLQRASLTSFFIFKDVIT